MKKLEQKIKSLEKTVEKIEKRNKKEEIYFEGKNVKRFEYVG